MLHIILLQLTFTQSPVKTSYIFLIKWQNSSIRSKCKWCTDFRCEKRKKYGKCLFLIHQCVDSNIFEKIIEEETSKDVWDTLKKLYGGDEKFNKVKLQALRKQLKTQRWKYWRIIFKIGAPHNLLCVMKERHVIKFIGKTRCVRKKYIYALKRWEKLLKKEYIWCDRFNSQHSYGKMWQWFYTLWINKSKIRLTSKCNPMIVEHLSFIHCLFLHTI